MTPADYTAKANEAADDYAGEYIGDVRWDLVASEAFKRGIAWSRLNVPPEVTAMRDALYRIAHWSDSLDNGCYGSGYNYEGMAFDALRAFDAQLKETK